ncbi:MAG: substrate-binding periplasmic protein [Bdellovibrionales bacterium]
MRLLSFLLAFLIGAGIIIGVQKYHGGSTITTPAATNTLQRVIDTGVLRCGYYVFAPYVYKDDATGKLSGPSVDIMERIAEDLGVKIEWAEEQSFGTWATALQTRRIDMMCAPLWTLTSMAREVVFSSPIFFTKVNMYVREGDTRFDGDLNKFNSPDVTLSVIENNVTIGMAKLYFPLAKTTVLPPSSNSSHTALDVITNKADALFWDSIEFIPYEKSNPGKLRNATEANFVRVMPLSFGFTRGDEQLANTINTALRELDYSGFIKTTLAKWLPAGAYKLPAAPYAQ